ncbi:hypothetical protein Mapa_002496 [Marchantia paleacea]|nr:hypothetical protein Mapa_002496 [Marchantia paleacea]
MAIIPCSSTTRHNLKTSSRGTCPDFNMLARASAPFEWNPSPSGFSPIEKIFNSGTCPDDRASAIAIKPLSPMLL